MEEGLTKLFTIFMGIILVIVWAIIESKRPY